MVATFTTIIAILSFLCGLLLGLNLRQPAKARPIVVPEVKASGWRFPLFTKTEAKPEPKKPTMAAIPRTPGSWRRQKADLERQHNTRQKERDQRVASI